MSLELLTRHRKVLVIDATHPDEPRAGKLYESLKKHPIRNVDTVIGNEDAYHFPPDPEGRKLRYLDANLNLSYPGNPNGNREERRAYYLRKLAAKYSVVLDCHAGDASHNTAYYGPSATPLVKHIPDMEGMQGAIVMSTNGIVSVVPHAITIDIHRTLPLDYYLLNMRSLASVLRYLPEPGSNTPRIHKEFHLAGAVNLAQLAVSGLADMYVNFCPLPEEPMRELGFAGPTFAFGWNSKRYGYTGYAGEVLSLRPQDQLRIPEPTLNTVSAVAA